MKEIVCIKDKKFKPFISSQKIQEAVKVIAQKINHDLKDDFPLFLVVLNGSFMFAADLLKEVNVPCEISFVKVASYHGTSSSGVVNELIGLTENIENRVVVIVEDIVDTGLTLGRVHAILQSKKARSVKVATAFIKPDSYNNKIPIDYSGVSIGNEFVLGYGLDYLGQGRNLKDLYILTD